MEDAAKAVMANWNRRRGRRGRIANVARRGLRVGAYYAELIIRMTGRVNAGYR